MKNSKAEIIFTIALSQAVLLPFYLSKTVNTPLLVILGSIAAILLLSLLAYRPLPTFLYKQWLRFSDVFAKINSFMLLAIVYCLLIVPFGIVLRLITKDPLARKIDTECESYYINSVAPHSMEKPY